MRAGGLRETRGQGPSRVARPGILCGGEAFVTRVDAVVDRDIGVLTMTRSNLAVCYDLSTCLSGTSAHASVALARKLGQVG